MNGFNNTNIKEEHKDYLSVTSMLLQSFFPPINLNEIEIQKCKRVLLFNLNLDDVNEPVVEFRHYYIDIEKCSIKKTVKIIVFYLIA